MTENNKIPEYAKDFKKEWLYIRGINKLCGEFIKKLGDNTDSFEEVFSSSRAKALISHFKDVLEAQKMRKLQNISKLKFKLSDVEDIIQIRIDLYYNMKNIYYYEYLLDEDFQDFFENLIIFTNDVNIKNEDDFFRESISEFESESESESESEIDFENEIENLRGLESESESESESD